MFRLFASTRQDEFAALGWERAQLEALLRMQWSAQERWYSTAYAPAQYDIVTWNGSPIGRIIVQRGAEAATLVDISLLPEYRGRGIGTLLIRDLIEQCNREKVCLRLQVLKSNPATHLYMRLGFTPIGDDGMYFQMEKPPEAQDRGVR